MGPRQQKIAEAEARLKAGKATLENDLKIYNRQKKLYNTDFASRQQLDIAKKNYLNAKEKVAEYTEQLDELLEGTRVEQLQQARANVATLTAQLTRLELLQGDYQVRAPRPGVVDSLPFKKGDRPPAHAVVSTLLVGVRPWARIYVPGPYRSKMKPGDDFIIQIDGREKSFAVRLRTISSEASFTPYYALTERDRSRLSYVATLDLLDEESARGNADVVFRPAPVNSAVRLHVPVCRDASCCTENRRGAAAHPFPEGRARGDDQGGFAGECCQ